MSLPTMEDVSYCLEDNFQKDIKTRRKLKELNKWNKLTLKTKLKRLKDNVENEIKYINFKYMHDVEQIKNGIHPELGLQEDYTTHTDDWVFKHMVKMRNKRLKKYNKVINI